jgi:hypothetical protein
MELSHGMLSLPPQAAPLHYFSFPLSNATPSDLESQADEVDNYETAWQWALYDQVRKLKLYRLMDYLRKSDHQDD